MRKMMIAATRIPTMYPATAPDEFVSLSRKLYTQKPSVACVRYANARYNARMPMMGIRCRKGSGAVRGNTISNKA